MHSIHNFRVDLHRRSSFYIVTELATRELVQVLIICRPVAREIVPISIERFCFRFRIVSRLDAEKAAAESGVPSTCHGLPCWTRILARLE